VELPAEVLRSCVISWAGNPAGFAPDELPAGAGVDAEDADEAEDAMVLLDAVPLQAVSSRHNASTAMRTRPDFLVVMLDPPFMFFGKESL
jgi:hypothetical protein